jgi:hypothetical protein
MRLHPILRRTLSLCLAVLFALLTGLVATSASASASASASTPVIVSGCSAYAGAKTLGTSYSDARIRVYACGRRPSFDGARNGTGPLVRPFAGSPIYYSGYQCIELVARYLKLRFGADPGFANGAQAVDRYAAVYPATFVKIANGTKGKAPRKGDVLSLSAHARFDDVGHTGVVVSSSVSSVGNGTIRVMEENWGGAGGTAGYHNYAVKNWRVVFAALPHIKWLRAR